MAAFVTPIASAIICSDVPLMPCSANRARAASITRVCAGVFAVERSGLMGPWRASRHADEVAAEEAHPGEYDPEIRETAQQNGSVPHFHELPNDDAHLHERDQDRTRCDRGVRPECILTIE